MPPALLHFSAAVVSHRAGLRGGAELTQRTLLFRRTLMEQWEFSASGGFDENARALRYLSPSGSSAGLELWGKENGVWQKLETEEFGSYLRFTVPAGVFVLAVTYYTPLGWLWVILGALAAARASAPELRPGAENSPDSGAKAGGEVSVAKKRSKCRKMEGIVEG